MAVSMSEERAMTLTVLGCGALGSAILTGIISSIDGQPQNINIKKRHLGRTCATVVTPASSSEDCPPDRPSRFIACVRTEESATRLENEVSGYSTQVTVLQGENERAVREADIVILGCLPNQLHDCISELGIRTALRGKLLISLLGRVTVSEIEDVIYDGLPKSGITRDAVCRIVRAMPNTASCTRESMTVITTEESDSQTLNLVNWLFGSIGEVAHVSCEVFDACTALCGSGPAFFALFLEAMVDAAVALGVKRQEAQILAAYTMRGTSGMVLAGEHPAVVREKVATPGGSTMVGLLKLEEGRARSTIATALIDCAEAARSEGMK